MSLKASQLLVQHKHRNLLELNSFELNKGESLAVLGANGAGKSTLLSCLSGERNPIQGHISLKGRPFSDWTGVERAKCLAVMPQSVVMAFPMRVSQVVAMGRSPYADEASTEQYQQEAMQETDVCHLKDRQYPSLSGGEQQRVQLARVLVQIWEARLSNKDSEHFLLLDECTSALDLSHQHAMMCLVKEYAASGVGVLAVMHDTGLAASWADRVVILKNGQLLQEGSSQLLADPELLQQAYDLPKGLAITYAEQNKNWLDKV